MHSERWYEKFERIGDRVAEVLTPMVIVMTLLYLAVRVVEAF